MKVLQDSEKILLEMLIHQCKLAEDKLLHCLMNKHCLQANILSELAGSKDTHFDVEMTE